MRASRLISILLVLQTRGCVTAEALAEEFEVSVRTIYRDVDELSASGIPVYADRGPGGGFQLQQGYRTRLTGLTPEEASTLLLVGLPGPAADLGLASTVASVERKVLAALPADQAARAIEARRRVLLDPLNWQQHVERPRYLLDLAEAVWNQTCVTVRYESWKAQTTRTLEPFGLVIKGGIWYLVARVSRNLRQNLHQNLCTYKVSQISYLLKLDAHFDVPATFDLSGHWTAQLNRFEQDLYRDTATVSFSEAAMCRIERLGSRAAEAIRASTPDASGWRTANIPIEDIQHAAMDLICLGPHAIALSPPALVQRLRELVRQMDDLYEEDAAAGGKQRLRSLPS